MSRTILSLSRTALVAWYGPLVISNSFDMKVSSHPRCPNTRVLKASAPKLACWVFTCRMVSCFFRIMMLHHLLLVNLDRGWCGAASPDDQEILVTIATLHAGHRHRWTTLRTAIAIRTRPKPKDQSDKRGHSRVWHAYRLPGRLARRQ